MHGSVCIFDMRILFFCWAAGSVVAAISHQPTDFEPGQTVPGPLSQSTQNANHIFNAIRGTMRQWDSSWNHNGMSFFLAEVPTGVQVYHGTSQERPVTGMEWLAFEPEHALMFAHGVPRRRPAGDPKLPESPRHPSDGPRGSDRQPIEGWHDQKRLAALEGPDNERRRPYGNEGLGQRAPFQYLKDTIPSPPASRWERQHRSDPLKGSKPVHSDKLYHMSDDIRDPPPIEFNATGFLHTYRTKHPLNLLLIDGMSAGKTSKGTLDSQDYVLRFGLNGPPPATFGDRERAQALCNVSRDSWDDKIDGFIRMEAGFEIILCSFSAHLSFQDAQVVQNHRHGNSGGPGPGHDDQGYRFYRAVADRFYGIGADRVEVNWGNFVSAFSYDTDLFSPDPILPNAFLPRLRNKSSELLTKLQNDVHLMVTNPLPRSKLNWQHIADAFVQRYADPLQYLVSAMLTESDLENELKSLLRPFISDRTNDTEVRTRRCVNQFLPTMWQTVQAGKVVEHVSHKLCSTLIQTLDTLSEPRTSTEHHEADTALTSAQSSIQSLISWLDWPVWRQCVPGCSYDELCVLPIWPITGDVEDRKQPRCKNATAFEQERRRGGPNAENYWYDGDSLRRPGSPPPPPW